MKKRLDETIGRCEYDNLFAGTYPGAEVFHVVIAAVEEETEYKRGTALAILPNGKMAILGTAGAVANCVLCDDVTAGTEDVKAVAYRTGHFSGNRLTVAGDYEITAEDKEAFRKAGILLSDAI